MRCSRRGQTWRSRGHSERRAIQVPTGVLGHFEPHATASNPAAPAAMSVSLDRLEEIPDFMSYHHSCATKASDNGGEYTAILPNACFASVVRP